MTQEQAVLTLLRASPCTTGDFIGSMYGLAAEYRRAISTLRRKGYVITAERVSRGSFRYRLEAEPPTIEATGQLCFVA